MSLPHQTTGDLITATIWNNVIDGVNASMTVAPRVVSNSGAASPITPNADTTDLLDITALAVNLTISAPTGTPSNGQRLSIRIKDNGVARTLTWNAAFATGGATLPTVTIAAKILNLFFKYDTANALNKWQLLGVAQEP